MSISQLKGGNVPIELWTNVNEVESGALDQLRNVSKLPWVYHHVAVMADVHYGNGCSVGSVVATKNAISPSMAGVDLGCGMIAVKTNLTSKHLPDNLKILRSQIEEAIPMGFNSHKESLPIVRKSGLFDKFKDLHPKIQDLLGKATHQIGTLGQGNHFIELCIDTEDNVWIMLHSGSRGIGKSIADVHFFIAKELAHNNGRNGVIDPSLAVFLSGTKEIEQFRHDLYWCQEYALLNRQAMLDIYMSILRNMFPTKLKFEEPIQCHHNYVAEETHFGEKVFVTRKGAINAEKGRFGIIPGSMATSSFIVKGLGNPDSFNSASHGAGRRMSRGEAKRRFTIDDVLKQTEGVECRKDAGIIDELPAAYKDIYRVMDYQKDLVEIVAELKQVMCCKG